MTGRSQRVPYRIAEAWLLGLAMLGCPSVDGTEADSAASEATADSGATPAIAYAACDDPNEGCAGDDCRERDVDGAAWTVCIPPCREGADCPTAPGSNASPVCEAGRCAIVCNPSVAVCPSGMTCVDGDPAQCMWPVDPGVADLDELCAAACEGCMAAALLGWPEAECATACAADLGDCSGDALTEALVCPGDLACSVGGLALASCLDALACKD